MVDLLKFLYMMLLDICEDMGHIMSCPLKKLFFFYFQFWKKAQDLKTVSETLNGTGFMQHDWCI